MTVTVCQRNSE